jgi:excinuclease ABC subunit B
MIAEMPPKFSKTDTKIEPKAAQKNAGSDPQENAGHELDPAKFATFSDSPYQLYQPFPPAGDQPAAIDALLEGVEDGLTLPNPIGGYRVWQDFHDGQCDRQNWSSSHCFCPE